MKKTTRHGRALESRAQFLIREGKIGEWIGNELEGGKDFPSTEAAGLDKYPDDVQYDPSRDKLPPVDGTICSGGQTNQHGVTEWQFLNNTDDEILALIGKRWPKIKVKSGQEFISTWTYTAAHKTRAYNSFITKTGWDPTQRITVDSLSGVPFDKHFYDPELPYNGAPREIKVILPERTGYHVLIVAWIIQDTAHAFYQTFDLDFDNSGEPEPGPTANITPNRIVIEKGETATFSCSAEGETPFTYLWDSPSELGSSDGSFDKASITYTTNNISGDKIFEISCTVTDKNGKNTRAYTELVVEDSSAPVKPILEIVPNPKIVEKGVTARLNAVVTFGKSPFTYKWNLPAPLTSPDIGHNMNHITYVTDKVESTTTFEITCTVTDDDGQTADAIAQLIVRDSTFVLEIQPNPKAVLKGTDAKLLAVPYHGNAPYTYKWNLPAPLTSPDITAHFITYGTNNVEATSTFDITCTVTDKDNRTADAVAVLIVREVGGGCTDPEAGSKPAWDPARTYDGENKHEVSCNGVIWRNKNFINPGAPAPDSNNEWELRSVIAIVWTDQRSYDANTYVNHNGSQWKAAHHAGKGEEPGATQWGPWQNRGSEACEPQ